MATNWRKVISSVSSSLFGVQSQQNYEEDFSESNSPFPFIFVGVVFVAIFVISLIGVVSLIAS